jgi:hypothetical protein
MESRIIKLNCAISRRTRQLMQRLADLSAFSEYSRVIRSLNSSGPTRRLRLANGTTLQAMNEPFPQWPGLFRKFVLPSGPKHLLLNLWITDSQATTPIECFQSRVWIGCAILIGLSLGGKSKREYLHPLKTRAGHRVSAKGFLTVRKVLRLRWRHLRCSLY